MSKESSKKTKTTESKYIINPKLYEIKQTKAISWKKFAEFSGLNYTVLADVLNCRRYCTFRYAQRLVEPLAEYNIIVTAEEIVGIKPERKKKKSKKTLQIEA